MLPIHKIRENLNRTLDQQLEDGKVDSDHQRQLREGFFPCGTYNNEGSEYEFALPYYRENYGKIRTEHGVLNARGEVLAHHMKVYAQIPSELLTDGTIQDKIKRVLALPGVDITTVPTYDPAAYRGGTNHYPDGKTWIG